MRIALRLLATPLCVLPCLWAAAALWIDGPASRPLAACLALGLLMLAGLLLWRVRPYRRACLACLGIFVMVLAWWLSLAPSNARDWLPDVARLPRAHVEGARVTLENVRNFHYLDSDSRFEEAWETRRYNLDQLVGLDIYLSEWGAPGIAHTIMAWRFADAPPLAISIETRKERGEEYSAIRGFFRQYELYYVVADERDVIGVRARYRGERIRLFTLRADAQRARRLLDGYLEDINRLATQPRWYNAFTTNCTTVIFDNVRHVFGLHRLLDWRVYANAHLPAMLQEQGSVNTQLPYDELMRVSDITERVQLAGDDTDFSTRIRIGLPPPPTR